MALESTVKISENEMFEIMQILMKKNYIPMITLVIK